MTRWIGCRPLAIRGLWIVVATIAVCQLALAQDSEPDPVATALFRRGRDLIQQGQWQQGCDKLSASMARYPAASTLLNLAKCDEHDGKVASAWTRYQRALSLTRELPQGRRREELTQIANTAISAIEPRLPKLQVHADSPPAGLRVVVADGTFPVDEPIPLDPGPCRVVASAPGFKTSSYDVVLKEGQLSTVTIHLEASSPAPSSAPAASTATAAIPPSATVAPSSSSPRPEHAAPVWPWWVGGLGIVSTAVSVGFALDARSQSANLRDRCGSDMVCNEDPSFDPDPINARKNRDIALAIGLGSAGVVAIGISLVGLLTSNKNAAAGRRDLPSLSLRGPGAQLTVPF